MKRYIHITAIVLLAAGSSPALGQGPLPHSPFQMRISQLPEGHQNGVGANPSEWIKFADPFGLFNQENGITDGEAAQFSSDCRYIITATKTDGRYINRNPDGSSPRGTYEWNFRKHPTMATARLRLWNAATGEMIWEKHRSRGPDNDGDFRPDDQPADRADEIEIAAFSPDDEYVAAGGEDDKIEIWRIKDDATGDLLSDPVLVKTFHTAAGVDGMIYSHRGDLIFAGTENAGEVEVFRVQGDPTTWRKMGVFKHGGAPGNAVNSLEITQDDEYVATHGTNREGVFWDLTVTRDNTDLITDVNMTKIATLGDTSHFFGSGREARFSNDGGPEGSKETYLTLTNERDYMTRVYHVDELKSYRGPHDDQNRVPAPLHRLVSGDAPASQVQAIGTEVEPADFTKSGRFYIQDGDSRGPGNTGPNNQVLPGFFRIYETAEWATKPTGEEPDPIWVQRALSTEFLNFNHDDTRLASGQGDGTLRVWDIAITDARTIESEGFNENPQLHSRWTLSGSRSTTRGDDEWGTGSQVHQDGVQLIGERGTQYLAADNLQGETHALTLNDAWDISGFTNRQVQFAAAAAPRAFESGDFLRLLADLDDDGTFEATIAEFLPDGDGDLAWNGHKLSSLFEDDAGNDYYTFQDFFVDLEPLLPANFGGKIRFQIQANTDSSLEEIGFDSLRVTGVPVPER